MAMFCRQRSGLISVLLVFLLATFASYGLAQNDTRGHTQFVNSGSEAAQQDFLDGLLMLHSFQYEDARELFLAAQQIDPDFVMAYWGEAMTHNYPLWFDEPQVDAAVAALAKLGESTADQLAKAPTERERAYLAAVQKLFGAGERQSRDVAYLAAMQQLAEDYPEDLDAALFLALAHLGASHGGRDVAIYMQAAAIAEEVFARNPRHPGAAHYLIHSYDDPIHAPLGLRAARIYADLAPSASHAQHMPSHIFYALGMWQEATQSNIDAYVSDSDRSAERGIALSTHGYHAIWWLLYSQLQEGLTADALDTLEQAERHFTSEESTSLSREIIVFMHTHYAIETGDWHHAFDTPGIDWIGLEGRSLAAHSYVRAGAALEDGDINGAKEILDGLEDALSNDDVGSQIMQLELEAMIQLKEGNGAAAMVSMERATALEESMPLYFGPPWPIKPSHELYGEMLLELGRPVEAAAQFSEGLARLPGRALSLTGLARAEQDGGQ